MKLGGVRVHTAHLLQPFCDFLAKTQIDTLKCIFYIYLIIYLITYKIHFNAPRVVRIYHKEHQVNEPLASLL